MATQKNVVSTGKANGSAVVTDVRETRNGIKEPKPGGKCAAIWRQMDSMVKRGKEPHVADARTFAEKKGYNVANAQIEFYRWRAFHAAPGAGNGKANSYKGPFRRATDTKH